MSQTRLQSLLEAWANVLVGWLVGLVSQILIFPFFGIQATLTTNLKISLWFTVISIARSYALRRYYNWKHGRAYQRGAK